MPAAALMMVLAFWGGMAAAAHAYRGYDWPYQTISVLLYADQNPRGYVWAWAGLWLCGLAGLAWTVQLRRRLDVTTTRPAAMGLRVLQCGFLCMCVAMLPDRVLPWPKGHEMFAILAFLGLCVGVTFQMAAVVGRVVALLPLLPLVLAGSTQAWLAMQRPNLPWVTPRWRALGISPLLSFALWEWVSCAVLSACLLMLWGRGRTRERALE